MIATNRLFSRSVRRFAAGDCSTRELLDKAIDYLFLSPCTRGAPPSWARFELLQQERLYREMVCEAERAEREHCDTDPLGLFDDSACRE